MTKSNESSRLSELFSPGRQRRSAIMLMLATMILSGCAKVPLAPEEADRAHKLFASPRGGVAGLYLFRDSMAGLMLKKTLYVDGERIGETAPMTYLYTEVAPGKHVISTESEFGNNELEIDTESGQLYFVRQYLKMGVFVAGANLQLVPESKGRERVLECRLADSGASWVKSELD